jgi:hypothetical protein
MVRNACFEQQLQLCFSTNQMLNSKKEQLAKIQQEYKMIHRKMMITIKEIEKLQEVQSKDMFKLQELKK